MDCPEKVLEARLLQALEHGRDAVRSHPRVCDRHERHAGLPVVAVAGQRDLLLQSH